jgi:hypothetical protein
MLDVLQRRPGEGEVEQHQVQAAFAAQGGQADVGGLDVPVAHAQLLQATDDLQQLLAEALGQVQGQPALLLQVAGQGGLPRALHVHGGAAGHAEGFDVRDDVGVAQSRQGLALQPQPLVVRRVAGHLEHGLLVAVALAHQQHVGGGALAEPLDHLEAALQVVAPLGLRRVHGGLRLGGRQLLLHLVQVIQELVRGLDAAAHVRLGAEANQLLQGLPHAVQGVGDAQAAPGPQALDQLQGGGGGGLAGEQVIGDGAQGEDVHVRARCLLPGQGLRGQVDHRAGARDSWRWRAGA